ncbi:hypothetical protein PsorP6_015084 [Peronosclerospora sorghi]|uniref:Uncharacterized protein n=1 Tax=Peronosclerospora sorghi TaxID=230839 RepID=A0ACC0VSN5_9STRA|nr:hypothetical protein PsorP6_015084 [Peronosclerospora sorghi]
MDIGIEVLWSYARKIELFLAQDNQHNMMRHHLIDSFLQRGEEESGPVLFVSMITILKKKLRRVRYSSHCHRLDAVKLLVTCLRAPQTGSELKHVKPTIKSPLLPCATA